MVDLQSAIATFTFYEQDQQEADKLIASFQTTFPRESLGALTLERYALGTEARDQSFCNWVEYKTDNLGRISGQESLKYVVYFSRTRQKWVFENNFKDEHEAFAAVKAGLIEILNCADVGHFSDIESIKPFENHRLVRGKVLFLYFPDKFVPVFSVAHLKDFCLQFGIKENYQSQIAMNRALQDFKGRDPTLATWSNFKFAKLLYQKFNPTHRFWKIAPGEGAKYWNDCLSGGYMCVGWDEMGDLTKYSDEDELTNAFHKECSSSKPDKWRELWDFFHVKEGDTIIANRGITSIVGVGTATGKYWFNESRNEYKHCIGVDWKQSNEFPIPAEARGVIKNWQFKTVKILSREDCQVLTPDADRGKLLWERIEPGFDLKLTNPDAVEIQQLRNVFEAFLSTPHPRQPGFNEHIRQGFKSWLDNPSSALNSQAYVTLSNWFLSTDKGYSESERGRMAGNVWDRLFLCRPDARLSISPQQSFEVAPAVFERWWAEQLRLQSQGRGNTTLSGEILVPKEIQDAVTTAIAGLSDQDTQSLDLVSELVRLGPLAIPVCLQQGYRLPPEASAYREIIRAVAQLASQDGNIAQRSIDKYVLSSNRGVRALSWEVCKEIAYFPEILLESLKGDEGILLPQERIIIADLCIRFSKRRSAVLGLEKYMCREYVLNPDRYYELCSTVARRMNELQLRDDIPSKDSQHSSHVRGLITAILIAEDTSKCVWRELREFERLPDSRAPEIEAGLLELMAEAFAATGLAGLEVLKAGTAARSAGPNNLHVFRRFATKLAKANSEAREWLKEQAAKYPRDWDVQNANRDVQGAVAGNALDEQTPPRKLVGEYLKSGDEKLYNQLRFFRTDEPLNYLGGYHRCKSVWHGEACFFHAGPQSISACRHVLS